MKNLTFIDLCLKGDVVPSTIDIFVEGWHNYPEDISLQEYLGMTTSEFQKWMLDDDYLLTIIENRKRKGN